MSFVLQQALQLHQAGQLEKAKSLYQKVLRGDPKNVNALQLLGSLYASEHQLDKAIALMQQAISIKPEQPQVLLNLAICLKRNNAFDQVLDACLKAIQYQPDNQQAHILLIGTLTEQGRYEDALACCEEALLKVTSSLKVLAKRASILANMERFEEAISQYQDLINRQPNNMDVIHDMAVVYRMQGKPEQALEKYYYLQKQHLKSYILSHNIANAHADLGQLEQAIFYYREALSQKADYVDAHVNLNELLWEIADTDAFLRSYVETIPLYPHNMKLKYAYANTLLRTSNYQICIDLLTAVPDSLRGSANYYDCLARAHKGLGNLKKCLALYQQATQQKDITKDQQLQYAQCLLEANEIQQATVLLETLTKNHGQDQFAWALLGVAWRLAKSTEEQQLNDYENLVKVYDIDIPDGFDSRTQFCAVLNQYLQELHTSENQPLDQTLTGGTQTRGNLFNNAHPLIVQLKKQLESCVVDYIQQTQSHDFLYDYETDEPFEFSGSWSVKLKSQGFHTPHVHPMGWISSAFYVDLPHTINDHDQQGWFCLGTPNLNTSPKLTSQKSIQPKVGRLVLFRSYMWHSTKPFESEQARTTVAFDVKMRRPPKLKIK
ncbi:tetratricopeptide repeat protein [Aliiglaciecola litoralis]|uniref:2OG-Fe(II) oxygenase n=1 Tax=Aliiglaciecola litoralis TaxID=582857 RepID=A0ABN1LLV6_9ALTE